MKDWFVLYTGMLVIVGICEMLIPKGKLEKSVKNALSVIFAAAVFMPMLEKISGVDFDAVLNKTVTSYRFYTASDTVQPLFGEIIIGEYTGALSQTLLSQYEKSGRNNVVKVEVSVNESASSKSYACIESVNVYTNEENCDSNDLISFARSFYNDYSLNINIIYEPAKEE